MASRHLVTLLLFVAVAAVPALLPGGGGADVDGERVGEVPQEAVDALRRGRYWRASRILHQHVAASQDTSPRTLLLLAQADAGWGDWESVHRLLADRPWLDTISGGYGWKLLGRSLLERGQLAQGGQALSHYLEFAEGADRRELGLTELRRASALQQTGKHAEALAAYDAAARLLPGLGDWIALWTAELTASAGDTAATRARLADLDATLAARRGWRLPIRAAIAARDRRGALRIAERAAGYLDAASDRATAWRIAGDIRLELGDTAAARDAYTRAIEASAGSSAAVDAARQMSALRGLSAADRLRIGRVFLRHGNRDRGIPALEAYLASAAAGTTRDEVELELGRAMFAAARYDDVISRMGALGARAGSERIASEALYLAARARYRGGDRSAAIAQLRRIGDAYPAEPAAVRANFLVADLAHDVNDMETARSFYHRAIQSGPDINEAGHAMMRLAGIAYQNGDLEDAERIFDDYLAKYPEGRRAQQAAYWSGKTKLETGRTDAGQALLARAARMDALTWYGMRAAERLGRSALDAMHLEPSPVTPDPLRAEVAAAMARVDMLRELGREEAATLEVDRMKRHFASRDGALYLIAEGLNARGMTVSGIRLGWEIREQEGAWNRRLLRIIYPFPYSDLILAEAPERGLDPFLVAGLIRQESMFDADIASGAGAKGLMQIMPATGQALARGAGIRDWDEKMLERPEINVHLGTTYFAEMLGRYGGRVGPALAAYNAGPNRVQRWRSFPEYQDDELFMERIPFDETRDYLKKVQQNARIYRFLYEAAERTEMAS